MRFEGDTFFCDYCGREFSYLDDAGFEDDRVCPICASKAFNDFLNSKCVVCGKRMGHDEDPWSNLDEQYCHEKCINQLSEKTIEDEEWFRLADQY